MNCPHCNGTLKIPDNTSINMECYQKPVFSVTLCCGKGVHLFPRTTYTVEPDKSGRTQDDWGRRVST